jgi:S-(hydroxymethyl)glutathione dehydrogenase/alcohol dehydrogenase
MRAAVLTEFGAPLVLREVDIEEPGPSEVRVRIKASGVCGSDAKVWAGRNPLYQHPPIVLGHESVGVVDAVGPGVHSVRAGETVLISMNRACGRCPECAGGRQYLCTDRARRLAVEGRLADGTSRIRAAGVEVLPFIGIGSFAEYAVVGEQMLVPLASEDYQDVAALLTCAVITGVGAVRNVARVRPGASVLIVGCGGVGINVVQAAVLAGARRVIAADTNGGNLDLARRFGATDLVLADDDLAVAVGRIESRGVDFAFDATGVVGVAARAMSCTAPGGLTVLVGSPPSGSTVEIAPALFFGDRGIRGCVGGNAGPAHDLPMLVDLVRQKRLSLEPQVMKRIRLDDVPEVLSRPGRERIGRTLVVFDLLGSSARTSVSSVGVSGRSATRGREVLAGCAHPRRIPVCTVARRSGPRASSNRRPRQWTAR